MRTDLLSKLAIVSVIDLKRSSYLETLKKIQTLWPQYDLFKNDSTPNRKGLSAIFFAKRLDVRLSPSQTVFATDNQNLGKLSNLI